MKLGLVHFHGAHAWPDHVLDYSSGTLLVGTVLLHLRGFVIGWELHAKRDWNPWLAFYVGWWAFEVYYDADRSYEDPPDSSVSPSETGRTMFAWPHRFSRARRGGSS